ncbi:MAG: enoyl-CoA hydratase/isomerase family protein [Actinomycetota bacterium]
MPSLNTEHGVAVLDLGSGENRFTLAWLEELDQLLDKVLADPPPAMVTTGTGKFYSNGLDVAESEGPVVLEADYVRAVQELYSRILTLPLPTAAAINGHAFGAGALLAMAHDYRVMRADRGFFCFPEVHVGIPFPPGMAALAQCKLDPLTARNAMLTGRRFGGEEAAEAGLADAAVGQEELIGYAAALAAAHLPGHPATLGTVKAVMYAEAVQALALPHQP